jgi:hypothetical protein
MHMCGFGDFAKQRNGGGGREQDLYNIMISVPYFPVYEQIKSVTLTPSVHGTCCYGCY